jgi:hypothetical protein
MEAQAKSNVCPRCNGTGELKSCAHVKGGVCFNCWGCGSDLGGEIREAQRALSVLRGRWVYMSRKARRAAPGSLGADACAQALDNLVVEGKKAARLVEVLLRDREALAAKFKSF